jgi:RNA polymerase sigma-70 factor, ECF subfamily
VIVRRPAGLYVLAVQFQSILRISNVNRGQAEITELLRRLNAGDKEAERILFEAAYDELRRLAARAMRAERPGHTLQPTALVHEAYFKLVKQANTNWDCRAHFFAVASTVMRRILVDHAKARLAKKRRALKVSLGAAVDLSEEDPGMLVELGRALDELTDVDPRQSQIVDMKAFGGLTAKEISEFLGISTKQVERDWKMAKAWLFGKVTRGRDAG